MKYLYLFFIFFLLVSGLFGQESITLEWNKDALILLDETEFRVTGTNSGVLRTKIKIQINNVNGNEYSDYEYYDNDYFKLEDIEAFIKDLDGEIIRELDDDDIHHSNITQDISDGNYYWFSLHSPRYPCIFECNLEYEYKTLFMWPDWNPEADIPILTSRYRIIKEAPVAFKMHSVGLDVEPKITISGGDSIFTWELSNIPAKETKYRTPPEYRSGKQILFACNRFEVDNFPGTSQTWDDLADWLRTLYAEKYTLSEDAKNEIRQITSSDKTDYEKVQTIFSFLQENTRYVAIELGIGRWQPYSADWVFNKKYGDCKDLSTCMISMLDAVGIKAYPAFIKTRTSGIVVKEFPSNQFNHVIVFVPLTEDTLWLEATADYLKAGELPSSREGCDVLVVKEKDSEVLRTPLSTSGDNLEISHIEGVINSRKGLEFEGTCRYRGNDKYYMDPFFKTEEKSEIEKFLQNYLGEYESTPQLSGYNIDNSEQDLILTISGELKNFVNQTNKRIFFNPNILNRVDFKEELKEEIREFPVYYAYPYTIVDTIIVNIPKAKEIESAPKAVEIDSSFARYKVSYEFFDKRLIYVRYLEIKERLIPVDAYDDYVDFMLNIEKNDRKKFVFLKL